MDQVFRMSQASSSATGTTRRSVLPVEGLVWGDGSKMTAFQSGDQWFNPLTTKPHPMLQQKLPLTQRRSYDFWLSLSGLSLDSMETIAAVTVTKNKTGTLLSYRSSLKLAYCLLIDLLVAVNCIRLIATFYVHDPETRFRYLGDLSLFWDRKPNFLVIPMLIVNLSALAILLFFQFKQSDRNNRWILPLAVLSGLFLVPGQDL